MRLRVVRHLSRHDSATLAELADAAGVHLNTIRGHVASLEEAEVLASTQKAATGPGRPPTEYRLVDGWGLSSTDFLELAGLLAAALVRSHPDHAVGAGDRRRLGPLPGRPPGPSRRRDLRSRWRSSGADSTPTSRARPSGSTGCPCAAVSPDHPEVVCALATGLVDGVLAASGSDVRVAEHDANPEARRCTLRLTRSPGLSRAEPG